jgi:hypothetical protein
MLDIYETHTEERKTVEIKIYTANWSECIIKQSGSD